MKKVFYLFFCFLVIFASCTQGKTNNDNTGGKDNGISQNPPNQQPETKPSLYLTRLEVGESRFVDLESNKMLNAKSVANDVEKVEVIAEASEGANIEYIPALKDKKFWELTQVGQNTLSIKLTKDDLSPQIYTVNILRRAVESGKVFSHIARIYTGTAENGKAWSKDFSSYKEALIEKDAEKKYCMLDAIYPEDYLGFIFVLDGGEISKVEGKSMNASSYEKMYYTLDEIVSEGTATPYRVYYFAKYSFSKQFSETASVKVTYKDNTEDEFVVKAKQGIISE